MQCVLHEPVEFMEIDIGKNLAREVADGNAAPTIGKLSLSLETRTNRVAINDVIEQLKRSLVLHAPSEEILEYIVIHIIEELVDVRSPEETLMVYSEKVLCSVDAPREPLAFPARPRIEEEYWIVAFDEIVVQEPVDDPVTERSDGDTALLRVIHGERPIRAVTVGSVREIFVE